LLRKVLSCAFDREGMTMKVNLPPWDFPDEAQYSHTDPDVRRALYTQHRGRDFYTGNRIKFGDMVVDHVLPRALGGPDNLYNYVPTVRSINSSKGKRYDRRETVSILLDLMNLGPRLLKMVRLAKFGAPRTGDGAYINLVPLIKAGPQAEPHPRLIIVERRFSPAPSLNPPVDVSGSYMRPKKEASFPSPLTPSVMRKHAALGFDGASPAEDSMIEEAFEAIQREALEGAAKATERAISAGRMREAQPPRDATSEPPAAKTDADDGSVSTVDFLQSLLGDPDDDGTCYRR
jgi:hypothetical protein